MGHVAIYCRVSTDDQSCELQERDLRAFAKRAGHKIVAVLKETASGADNGRPERAKVLALARARRIDAILVTELSRWAATELAPPRHAERRGNHAPDVARRSAAAVAEHAMAKNCAKDLRTRQSDATIQYGRR